MKIIGIDYGEVRTGIAISDELGIMAHGIGTIEHGENQKILIEYIKKIVKENDVAKIVIGYPFNMNGTKGQRIEKTDRLIKKIKKEIGVDVIKIDERLTTVSAHKVMTELNLSKERKKKVVDTISAEYILQMYLDKLKK